ncbi:MAG: hypothetical protein MRZ31_01985 [Dysosmobacter sp.]|uniref:hypothetical protein n=1 Tax=Dysosmobacter sp. TaxID=2591382 RepID=UPI00267217C7|nr:hypothetical protein [Dysosmobacter sp.]MCI6015450.1 hypothetical protein [Dysosmobacter sp.]
MAKEKENAALAGEQATGTPTMTAEEMQKMLEEARAAKEEAKSAQEEARAILEQANAALAAAKEAQEAQIGKDASSDDADPEEDEEAKRRRLFEEEQERERQYMAEKVPIELFKDNGKYKGDVLVCVNGERFLIKRGVRVEVPRYVALVLEESAKQDTATANLIESESSRYEAEAAALNI